MLFIAGIVVGVLATLILLRLESKSPDFSNWEPNDTEY